MYSVHSAFVIYSHGMPAKLVCTNALLIYMCSPRVTAV